MFVVERGPRASLQEGNQGDEYREMMLAADG